MKWNTRVEAAEFLLINGFYNESIILYWQVLRSRIFSFLLMHEVSYSSTRDALRLAINILNENANNISESICFFDTISTLAEWDEEKSLNKEEAEELQSIFHNLNKSL